MAEIGMRYPVWAELTSESNNTPVYGTGKVMGKAISANLTWEKDDSELYGDDAVAETDGSIVGYNLDLGTTQLAEDVEAAILGYKKVGDTDEYEITDDPAPYGGVGYIRVLKRNGVRLYKAVWYPKIQFGKNSESSNTKRGIFRGVLRHSTERAWLSITTALARQNSGSSGCFPRWRVRVRISTARRTSAAKLEGFPVALQATFGPSLLAGDVPWLYGGRPEAVITRAREYGHFIRA